MKISKPYKLKKVLSIAFTSQKPDVNGKIIDFFQLMNQGIYVAIKVFIQKTYCNIYINELFPLAYPFDVSRWLPSLNRDGSRQPGARYITSGSVASVFKRLDLKI